MAALLVIGLLSPLPMQAQAHPDDCAAVTLPGANVAGGEFNPAKSDAEHARDYIYPGTTEIALLKRLGLRVMRVPFLWERLQPSTLRPLDENEAKRIDAVVEQARANGLTVILDAHNYGRYRGVSLAGRVDLAKALSDFWTRVATRYRNQPDVAFGIMNEPHDIGVAEWAAIAKAALAGIRGAGADNVVLIPGTRWDGAHSWLSEVGGVSNASALLPLAAGDAHVVFEVHQYFDDDYSGTSESCRAASQVPVFLARVGAWAKAHRVRMLLGEFGVSRDPACVAALDAALRIIERDRASWYGWTYWAAGAWWGTYPFNIQTSDGDGPQADVLHSRAQALTASPCDVRKGR